MWHVVVGCWLLVVGWWIDSEVVWDLEYKKLRMRIFFWVIWLYRSSFYMEKEASTVLANISPIGTEEVGFVFFLFFCSVIVQLKWAILGDLSFVLEFFVW